MLTLTEAHIKYVFLLFCWPTWIKFHKYSAYNIFHFQKKEDKLLKLLRNGNQSKLSGPKLNELRKKVNDIKDP